MGKCFWKLQEGPSVSHRHRRGPMWVFQSAKVWLQQGILWRRRRRTQADQQRAYKSVLLVINEYKMLINKLLYINYLFVLFIICILSLLCDFEMLMFKMMSIFIVSVLFATFKVADVNWSGPRWSPEELNILRLCATLQKN